MNYTERPEKIKMITNKLIDRIIKAANNVHADVFETSDAINNRDFITTDIPSLNIALSGDVDGYFQPGFLMISGESKHFKTLYMLLLAAAFLKKHKDGIFILFDSEFGSSKKYLQSAGVDTNRVVHIPITNIEELKTQISKILSELSKEDRIFIGIDSIGNLASLKEVEDALEGKTVADMTRAKQLKSVFRIITPHLTLKNIYMVAINHVYKELGMFPKTIVGGGQGPTLSANDSWIITRTQEKEDKTLTGFTFNIIIEKSRTVLEKSRIPVRVSFEDGIYRYSGLLDLALESGHIIKPSNGWYQLKDTTDKVRESDTDILLETLLKDKSFKDFIKHKYQQAGKTLIQNAIIPEKA
jgi:hypothetical protein